MKRVRQISISIVTALAAPAICSAGAQAAVVTVGSPQPQAVIGGTECPRSCILLQTALPGATLAAPFDGAIVRWRFADGMPGSHYKLRVLKPVGGLTFLGAGSSAEVTPSGFGLETFATALPIQAGERIGIEVEAGATVAARSMFGAKEIFFDSFADGLTGTGVAGSLSERELGFNAEIQPVPTITAVDPSSGPLKGGNAVVIEGTDFEGASTVSFGAAAAKSYKVDSEGRIVAVAPAVGEPLTVPISVTTAAGTATWVGEYVYEKRDNEDSPGQPGGGGGEEGQARCQVPKLKGKRLKAAKKVVKRAHCGVGRVRKKPGARAKTGKVVRQRPKPGQMLRSGARVNLTLGR